MILLSKTFIYPDGKNFNNLSNEYKIIQLVNYICSEKNFQWKKEFLMVHMAWRWGNSFRPCCGVAKSVQLRCNLPWRHSQKLDSRPHYELRSTNAIIWIKIFIGLVFDNYNLFRSSVNNFQFHLEVWCFRPKQQVKTVPVSWQETGPFIESVGFPQYCDVYKWS